MGRHTIGDKRGSVRGAPPDVYMAFISEDGADLDEQWAPTFLFFKTMCITVPAIIVAGYMMYVLWCAITGRPVYEIPE